jgi:acetyltransferase
LDPPPDSAELAVVVADDWQNKGLGTQMLLNMLQIMIKRKIKKLHGDVFLENQKMVKLMYESGFKLAKEDSRGIRHFELPL